MEELKKAYKTLAKQFHPDLNRDKDTTKIMQDINNEYDNLFAQLKDVKTDKEGHTDSFNYRDVVNNIVKFDAITIDIIGSWIWVYGETYSIKETLKSLGFKWSGSNKKWYWTENLTTKRKKATSYDYKVNKYGKETIQTANKKSKVKITG
jgi:DnaJ-class molecular chaperone